jgi:hypothetical protein
MDHLLEHLTNLIVERYFICELNARDGTRADFNSPAGEVPVPPGAQPSVYFVGEITVLTGVRSHGSNTPESRVYGVHGCQIHDIKLGCGQQASFRPLHSCPKVG